MKTYSILITTKDRLEELKYTLKKVENLINRNDVECIICDDGSTDGTSSFILNMYPKIQLINNIKSKGLIFSRNRLLNLTTAKYAISLDDDAHFITENSLELIESYFKYNHQCGVLAFRIYWGMDQPKELNINDTPKRVKGFVGCGHVWSLEAWNAIPNYPDWFVFYGEEDFAAFQLFKKGLKIYYVPNILVHHRVDLKSRKKDKDYRVRLRRSLRSGWYLYFLFYPWKLIPKKIIYTLWMQLKLKVFKGDFKAFIAVLQALGDVLINLPRLIRNANRLTNKEFIEYSKLPDTKLYWIPEDK